jgi:quercetin dioxygenase-like cupin family protein
LFDLVKVIKIKHKKTYRSFYALFNIFAGEFLKTKAMKILPNSSVGEVVKLNYNMNSQNIPKLVTLRTGESFKVYQVTGHAGMKMPLHYSTKEAVVIIQEGFAQLKINDIKHILQEGGTFIIPAHQNYTLSLKTKFKALGIMSLDSNIEFVQ